MATFGGIKTNVQRNLKNETRTDIDAIIGSAVNDAIRFFAQEKLWFLFNTSEITLTSGNQVVPSLPSDFGFDEYTSLTVTDNGQPYILTKKTLGEFNLYNTSDTGIPKIYTWRNDQLLVYPAPSSSSMVLTLNYFSKTPDLVNDSDTNVWTINAPKLIEAKATAYLKNDLESASGEETTYNNRASTELAQLRKYTNRKRKTGKSRPHGATRPNPSSVSAGWW